MHLEASFASINKKSRYDDLVGYDKAQNSRKKWGSFITMESLLPMGHSLGDTKAQ